MVINLLYFSQQKHITIGFLTIKYTNYDSFRTKQRIEKQMKRKRIIRTCRTMCVRYSESVSRPYFSLSPGQKCFKTILPGKTIDIKILTGSKGKIPS